MREGIDGLFLWLRGQSNEEAKSEVEAVWPGGDDDAMETTAIAN